MSKMQQTLQAPKADLTQVQRQLKEERELVELVLTLRDGTPRTTQTCP